MVRFEVDLAAARRSGDRDVASEFGRDLILSPDLFLWQPNEIPDDAEVTVEWPRALGGGSSVVKTDRRGQYVAGRALQTLGAGMTCDGLTIMVRAPSFASAYSQRSDTSCDRGVVTTDFRLFPQQQ